MTGIALGWIGSISGFGSQVRNAKTSPSVDGRHMPANAATGVPVTENQISSRPALGLGSAKRVKGTRQRCSGFDSIDRQNGLARFRTFVTRFVIIDPGRFSGIVLGTPHWSISTTDRKSTRRVGKEGVCTCKNRG